MKSRILRLLVALVAIALLGGVAPSVVSAKSPTICKEYIRNGNYREQKTPGCISRSKYAQKYLAQQKLMQSKRLSKDIELTLSLPDIRVRQITGVSLSTNKRVQTTHSGQQSSIGWLGYGTTSTQISIDYTKIKYELAYKTRGLSLISRWESWIDSLSLGYGLVISGEGSATVSGIEYLSTTVSGTTMHIALGWEFWNVFEFLLGYRQEGATFKDFSYGGTSLSEPIKIDQNLGLIGLGLSF
tara:strand:+ start:254 stop:979 length:726 start_codon:yes stop_codon:yes gene_type:complete